jgi:hypothetical protein
LADRVRSELSWVVPDPRFFILSALYHLLAQLKDSASERERRHLELWREDERLARFTESGFAAFRESLSQEVCAQRFRVLCGSSLSRLGMVAGSVMNNTSAQRKLLDHSIEDIIQTAEGLKDNKERLLGSLETLKNAISGLQVSLHEEIDRAVAPYFDFTHSRIIKETLEAVENFPIHFEGGKNIIDYRWLFHQFHHVYREFRQSLARYLVDKVNLQVIEFAKKEEASLCERLRRGARAFWALFTMALEDYRRETGLLDAGRSVVFESPGENWQIGGMIAPPNFSAFVDQGAVGRGVLLMKLGLVSFTRLLGDIGSRLDKATDLLLGEKRHEGMIDEAIKLLKKEAVKELIQAFREYQERFKTDYLRRIADEETGRLLQEFELRAEMAQVNLGNLLQQRQTVDAERQGLIEAMTQAHQISLAMLDELEELRSSLVSTNSH